MAKQRRNQSAAIRFGPALTSLSLCLLIAGSAVGYVWQKSQIYQLGKEMRKKEDLLKQMVAKNEMLEVQLGRLLSPGELEPRARGLGLVPRQPGQVIRLAEWPAAPPQFAARTGSGATR